MRYIRYKLSNDERIGVLEDNTIYMLNYDNIFEAINDEEEIKSKLNQHKQDSLDDVTILPPTNASKVVCIGLNYKDHAQELKMELPKEPLLFMKPSTSIIASNDEIIYPKDTNKLDYEGELAIVILSDTNKNNNDEVSFAFSIINDVTARDLQEHDGQWTRAKSFDTFCPVGPVISTNIDYNNLEITTKVNNQIRQNSNTNNMVFSPTELVKYISNIMTLKQGDLIATGTPPGVGQLNRGDTVTITIEKIGTLTNKVK